MSFYDNLMEDLMAIDVEKGEWELIPLPDMLAPTYVVGDQKENNPEK